MYSDKKHKNYKNSKPHPKYLESLTSVGSSIWEYADDPNASKHVKFDTDYGYSSHEFYGGQQKNFYSYPYYYDSGNNMYETGNEIQNYYDTEDSQYTYYRRTPQQIRYTETDSAFTMADSDYENSGYDYHSKNSHNYRQSHRGKNHFSRNTFGENVSIYFAEEPRSHHAFQFKNSPRHDNSSPSERDTQIGSVTETDEDTDYTTDKDNHTINDMGKHQVNQVYITNIAENEGAFKKEQTTTDDQEMVISVTDYDKVPLLAFEATNSTQNSLSRVVYLPVLVSGMKNKDNILTSGNFNNQTINSQHFEIPEKPIENIQVYAALNTGPKNIFEQAKDNKQQKSELKSEKLESTTNRGPKSVNRKSDLGSESKTSKQTYTNLPSVLKVPVPSVLKNPIRKSKASEKKSSKIKNTASNTSISSGKSVLGVERKKKKSSVKKRLERKSLKKSKSNISRKSLISSSSTNSQGSTEHKRKSGARESKIKLPIGQTPQGNIEGSSYYSDTHELETERRKKSEKIKGKAQGTDPSNKESEKQEQSKLNMSKIIYSNNKDTNSTEEVKNIQSKIKIYESKDESPIEKKQSNEVSKNLSSLTLSETEGKNLKTPRLSTKSTMNQQRTSMIGKSQIRKKSVLPSDFRLEQNSKIATEMSFPKPQSVIKTQESKNFNLVNMDWGRNETQYSRQNQPIQGVSKSLVKKSMTDRGNSSLQKKTGVQSQAGNVGLEQNKEAEKILQRQSSAQKTITQGGRLSVIKESMKEGNNSEAQNQAVQDSRKSLAKTSQVEGETTLAQYQAIPGSRKSLAKDCKIGHETTLAEDQANSGIRKNLAKSSKIEGDNTPAQNKASPGSRKSLAKECKIGRETTPAEDLATSGIRRSLAKGSKIERETTPAEDQASQVIRKSLTKESKIEGENGPAQNQASPRSRKSLTKGSKIKRETNPVEDQATQVIGKSLTKGSNIDRVTTLAQNQLLQGPDDKEVKSIYLRKSQIDENQSIELDIDITKSVLKENKGTTDQIKSTGWRKSQVFHPQIQEKVNKDIKKSFMKTEAADVSDKDVMSQIDSMPPEADIKSRIKSFSDNNQEQRTRDEAIKRSVTGQSKSFGTDKERKGDSTVVGIKNEVNEKNKNVKVASEQKSAVKGRESSKARKNSDQKTSAKGLNELKISRIPVSEELSSPKTGQASSINQNDRGIISEKGFRKSVSEKKSIVSDIKKSVHAPCQKSTTKIIKEQSIIDKPVHFLQYLKNYEFSNLVTQCFRISQFILGVSTYDKFIEVLGNFS